MRKNISALTIVCAIASATLVAACTQMPTEKQSVSDLRPQISFRAESEIANNSRIFVDGLDMGLVADFLEGKAALRVLSGTHKVAVVSGATFLLDEKVYLGDGVNRSFIVK